MVSLDELDVGQDTVLRTKLETLLSSLDATDVGSADALPAFEKVHMVDVVCVVNQAQLHDSALVRKQRQVKRHLVRRTDRIKNQIDLLATAGHRLRISADDELIGAAL